MANEKRLIDADELLELYEIGEELEEYAGVLSVPIPVIRQNIKDMPTVDAVPVVRCKDCIHRVRGTWAKCHGRRPEEFCSDGERRFRD